MACDRVGVPVLKWSGSHDRRPTHIAWLLRWSQEAKRRITLTPEQVQTYVQQQDIPFPDHENGYYLLQREWYGVWVGKIVDWVLKNKFVKVI
jgi:NOL1/NOP2/fmu family ribosome biogenesis protein